MATQDPHEPRLIDHRRSDEHNRLYANATSLMKDQMPLHGVQLSRLGFFSRRHVRKAISLLERVVDIRPDNWAALWIMGMAFRRLGDTPSALAAFERSHRLKPDQPDVAREASLSAMDAGHAELALEIASRAARNDPNDPGLTANLALAYLCCQKAELALQTAKAALEHDPSDQVTRAVVSICEDVVSGAFPCPHSRADLDRWKPRPN